MIYQGGWIQMQGNQPLYSQGGIIQINNNQPNFRGNQAKQDEKTGEIVFENMNVGGFNITRRVLIDMASGTLNLPAAELTVTDGVVHAISDNTKRISYAELIGGRSLLLEKLRNQPNEPRCAGRGVIVRDPCDEHVVVPVHRHGRGFMNRIGIGIGRLELSPHLVAVRVVLALHEQQAVVSIGEERPSPVVEPTLRIVLVLLARGVTVDDLEVPVEEGAREKVLRKVSEALQPAPTPAPPA